MTKREAICILQIDEDYLYKDDNPRNRAAYRMAREAIANWEPVVHCKDCDRSKSTPVGYICTMTKASVASDGNGFCSNGRKK